MPTINRIDVENILSRFPDMEQLEEQYDDTELPRCLIVSAGFEPRLTALSERFNFRDDDVLLVIKYPEFSDARAEEFLGKKSDAIIVEFDETTILASLGVELQKLGDNAYSTIVDISGMASVTIFPVLSSVFDHRLFDELSIVYVEAEEYGPTKTQWNEFYSSLQNPNDPIEVAERYLDVNFQSVGVSTVFTYQLFPGINKGNLPTKVIAIPGFALERMKAKIVHCITQYGADTDELIWLLGKPPNSKNHWRLDAMTKLFGCDEKAVSYAVSTRTYQDVIRVLEDVWRSNCDSHHLVVATNASKMQNMALFFFLWMRGTTGLVLSRPQTYEPNKYSQGIGPQWWLGFGPVSQLRKSLESVDCLDFVWK